ncbi:hypothetical protein JP74_21260 [Devosia sp. 17-2-E-8]|nr:hypothetical protein JP74_21260 [Devosia sp. 17-2-E-8]
MAGGDFSVSPGEETDRFSDKEAKRLIELGHAKKAPPPRKPETKKEWDDEREKLIVENERLHGEVEEGKRREAELEAQIAPLLKLKEAVASFVVVSEETETTTLPPTQETRG